MLIFCPAIFISQGEYIDGSLLENYYMGTENFKRIQSRWKSAVVHAATRGNTDGTTNNPLRSFASPPSTPGDLNASTISTDLKPTSSFEVEQDNANNKNGHPRRPPPKTILAIKAAWAFMTKPPSFKDFTDSLFKRRILLHRASLALLARHELIIGSMVMHIILALLFGWVNKNVTPASVIAYLGIGSMFLLIANAQFIFYMFTNYHVSIVFLISMFFFLPERIWHGFQGLLHLFALITVADRIVPPPSLSLCFRCS